MTKRESFLLMGGMEVVSSRGEENRESAVRKGEIALLNRWRREPVSSSRDRDHPVHELEVWDLLFASWEKGSEP